MLKKTPLKKSYTPLKKSRIKRKSKSPEEIKQNREDVERMHNFFLEVWDSKPHFCEETGVYLGDECRSTMMHHLLWKSLHPEYKYEAWNIMILHPDIHALAHQNIDRTPKVKFKTKLLKEEFL